MAAPSIDDRLTELEIKTSLAEDLLEALNSTVFRQQQRIEQLQQEVISLRQQLQSSLPTEPSNPGDELPPHY